MLRRLGMFASFWLLSTAAFATTSSKLESELKLMVDAIQKSFYPPGETFSVFDTYKVVPKLILLEDTSTSPNAELVPLDETEMGVGGNSAFLKIKDFNAQLFVLGHELGHAFSGKLLSEIQCDGVNGIATEVVADLGSMYILRLIGLSFESIEHTVVNWQASDIFDSAISGDHPAGADRVRFLLEGIRQLKEGVPFPSVVRNVLHTAVP